MADPYVSSSFRAPTLEEEVQTSKSVLEEMKRRLCLLNGEMIAEQDAQQKGRDTAS